MVTSIAYVAAPSGPAILESVTPSTPSAAGGTILTALLSNFPVVSLPAHVAATISQGGVSQGGATVLSVTSSVFGTMVRFEAPPLPAGTVLAADVTIAPAAAPSNAASASLAYVDRTQPKIAGVYPVEGPVAGGTVVVVRIQVPYPKQKHYPKTEKLHPAA